MLGMLPLLLLLLRTPPDDVAPADPRFSTEEDGGGVGGGGGLLSLELRRTGVEGVKVAERLGISLSLSLPYVFYFQKLEGVHTLSPPPPRPPA